jgi:hypothetical protein
VAETDHAALGPVHPLRRFFELAALWALAVVQPVFAVVTDAPEFFVVRRLSAVEIVVFGILVLAVAPALLAALFYAIGRRNPRAADALHRGALALLVALIALRALAAIDRKLDLGLLFAFMAVALAVVAGLAFAWAYARWEPLRSFVLTLSPVALVFLALFVADTPLTQDELPAAADVEDPVPVVWVVFDELPTVSLLDERRRIDPGKYPAFAQLAEDGNWYRNAVTVHDHTTFAVPAILTGERPPADASPEWGGSPRSVFSLLRDDYRILAAEPFTALCPSEACDEISSGDAAGLGGALVDAALLAAKIPAPESFKEHIPEIPERGPDPGESFERFTASVAERPRAAFYFAHIVLPHQPWERSSSGRILDCGNEGTAARSDRIPTDQVWESGTAAPAQRRHLAQLEYTDRLLGELLRRLQRLGLYDDALVVVVADHGISFQDGEPSRRVASTNVGGVAPVPLFIKRPHQRRGRTDDRPASILDVLPTVADLLGVEVPWEVDGRSLVSGGAHGADEPIRIAGGEGDEVEISRRKLASEVQESLERKFQAESATGGELDGEGCPH